MAIAINPSPSSGFFASPPRFIAGSIVKWIDRALAVALFLLWTPFFIEHVNEWYLQGHGAYPPAWVLGQMVAHLGMMAGLIVILRWDRLGFAIVLASTMAGFLGIAFAIGWNKAPLIVLLNLAPLACFAASWILRRVGARSA